MKKKILLMPSPPNSGSIGSVTKCIGLAKEIERRGGDVRFVMGGKLENLIQSNGFMVYKSPVPNIDASISSINNAVEFMKWTGMTQSQYLADSVLAELQAISDFKPDVVFAEARPSASISTRIAKVPSAMIASWSIHPAFPSNKSCDGVGTRDVNQILAKHHLPEIKNITELMFQTADLKIAPTLPVLEPELQKFSDIYFNGYILDTVTTETDPQISAFMKINKPLIFIYLSVSALSPQLYKEVILQTFQNKAFKILCCCGYHYHLTELDSSVDHICFTRYVPTNVVINQANLVIFHGGQDTMLTALLHGLPSITVTGRHFERSYNAEQLARLGASIHLPVHAFRPGRLNQAVHKAISGPYQEKSKALSRQLMEYGGSAQCADLLLSF